MAFRSENMAEQTFDFWNDHSLEFLEMAMNRDYQERIENPDGYGRRTGDCGDTVEFFLHQQDGRISSISYDANGCMNTHACANTVVTLAQGKSVDRAWNIRFEDVIGYLQTLPEQEFHCAELAVGAFYLALNDLEKAQKSA